MFLWNDRKTKRKNNLFVGTCWTVLDTGNQNADVFNTHTRAQKKAALSVTGESYGFAQETAETATTSELENFGDRREWFEMIFFLFSPFAIISM